MRALFLTLFCFSSIYGFSQSFNEDKVAFSNYIQRMYKFKPFEGVKIVEDYDDAYLISVLSLPLDKYPNQSTMMRCGRCESAKAKQALFLMAQT